MSSDFDDGVKNPFYPTTNDPTSEDCTGGENCDPGVLEFPKSDPSEAKTQLLDDDRLAAMAKEIAASEADANRNATQDEIDDFVRSNYQATELLRSKIQVMLLTRVEAILVQPTVKGSDVNTAARLIDAANAVAAVPVSTFDY